MPDADFRGDVVGFRLWPLLRPLGLVWGDSKDMCLGMGLVVSSGAWCWAVSPLPSPHMAQEEELIQSENSASIFNTLSDIPSQMEDAELLLGEAMRLAGSLTDVAVETQRRKHLAYLIADQGQLLGTSATSTLSQVGQLGCGGVSPEEAQSARRPTAPLPSSARRAQQSPPVE